jgi:hypothetical protein
MTEESINLKVAATGLEALVSCLALGTLEAMRSGVLPLEAGLWALGRPAFWEPLRRAGISDDVVDIFRTADELDALEKLSGRAAAENRLDQMSAVIRSHLGALPEKSWRAGWAPHDVA